MCVCDSDSEPLSSHCDPTFSVTVLSCLPSAGKLTPRPVSVCCPHLAPIVTGSLGLAFLVCFVLLSIPKARKFFQPLLPTLLQGKFFPRLVPLNLIGGSHIFPLHPRLFTSNTGSPVYRPARMVPSITHGLILAPLASSAERELLTSQGPTSSPQPASLGLSRHCAVLCTSRLLEGRGRNGEAAGEEDKGRKGRGPHL